MYILNSYGHEIINSDFVERFCLVEKPDAALIIASYSADRPPVTMGRYQKGKEAEDALCELFTAIAAGQSSFYMPESVLYAGEHIKRDARVKRRGGS